MANEIIVDVGADETKVALLEDNELVELYFEKPHIERLVGNIYRGRVCSVLQGMQAAFIDIGYEKNAFLYVGDAIRHREITEEDEFLYPEIKDQNINEILKPGQEITVQVVKEPIGTKGPRVTTHITLPGRHLVLLPNDDYIGISRRIEDEAERSRLKKVAGEIKPKGMGLIIRTAAEGKSAEELSEDISFLVKLWNTIKLGEEKGPVPRCIHKDLSLIYRTVRDLFTAEIDKFIINDRQQYMKVLELVDMLTPSLKSRVEYFDKSSSLFEHYMLDAKASKALARKIWLKCGGYIIIDKTEALTVVDVNTGKYVGGSNLEDTVLKTNIEASREIAKQLRLRDIGGIIIIDFIDMHVPENQQLVMDSLKLALKKDRTRTTVVGMTGLGLIEMTRKKVRQELSTAITVQCPCCEGTGRILSPESVVRDMESKLNHYFDDIDSDTVEIEVHPSVFSAFTGTNEENVKRMEEAYNKKIIVKKNSELGREEIKIKEIDMNNLLC